MTSNCSKFWSHCRMVQIPGPQSYGHCSAHTIKWSKFGCLVAYPHLSLQRYFNFYTCLSSSISAQQSCDKFRSRIDLWKAKKDQHWMEPAEELAQGHKENWKVWKLLKRLCTATARSRDTLIKRGYLATSAYCECRDLQTTTHMYTCLLCPVQCNSWGPFEHAGVVVETWGIQQFHLATATKECSQKDRFWVRKIGGKSWRRRRILSNQESELEDLDPGITQIKMGSFIEFGYQWQWGLTGFPLLKNVVMWHHILQPYCLVTEIPPIVNWGLPVIT